MDFKLTHDGWRSRCDRILHVAEFLHPAEFDAEPAEEKVDLKTRANTRRARRAGEAWGGWSDDVETTLDTAAGLRWADSDCAGRCRRAARFVGDAACRPMIVLP